MNLLAITILLLGTFMYTQGHGNNPIQTWGAHKHNEKRVHYELVSKSGSFFSFKAKTVEIRFPSKVLLFVC